MSGAVLWDSDEAVAATGGASAARWRAGGISIDSRTIEPGDLFIALEGPRFDGHDFVANAFGRGAVAAMVSRDPAGLDATGPCLRVPDTMAGLEALGRAGRQRSQARIAAVTGSVGKTGTKEALSRALERTAPTHATAGSLNNHWGAPLSLARMPRDAAYGVFELGMNHAGELKPLSAMVRPHLAIITTVEAVHLEFFESVAAIADAKAEIFTGLEPGGTAVLNRDNAHYERLRAAALAAGAGRVSSFGQHPEADVRLLNMAQHPACTCIAADIEGQAVTYKVGAPGRHWAMNSLAVLAAVKALGADLGLAALALADLSAPKGRGRRHQVTMPAGRFEVIDESYNASPPSVRAALEILGKAVTGPRGRRIAVLGDMLELGAAAPRLHAELAEAVLAEDIDLVLAAGPNMARLFEALPVRLKGTWAPDSDALLPSVLDLVRPGDVVMVKGSFGSRMAPIVAALLRQGEAPDDAREAG